MLFFLFVTGDWYESRSDRKGNRTILYGDKSRSRSMGWCGLGLTIVKRILELHHSSLPNSIAVNNGTTMSFALEVNHEKI